MTTILAPEVSSSGTWVCSGRLVSTTTTMLVGLARRMASSGGMKMPWYSGREASCLVCSSEG